MQYAPGRKKPLQEKEGSFLRQRYIWLEKRRLLGVSNLLTSLLLLEVKSLSLYQVQKYPKIGQILYNSSTGFG